MKLIDMTNFVLRVNQNKHYVNEKGEKPFFKTAIEHWGSQSNSEHFRFICRYASFLKNNLRLWMFVPCNKEGKYITKPCPSDFDSFDLIENGNIVNHETYNEALDEYNEALEHIYFKGFSYRENEGDVIDNLIFPNGTAKDVDNMESRTIEDLVNLDIELSDNIVEELAWKKKY